MASPQKENGYTPVANSILEAIYSTCFNATELKIILLVMRYTYGFSRKEHELSLTFISKGIGASKRYVSDAVAKLIKNNVLSVVSDHTDTQSRVIKLNKDFDKWSNRTKLQQMNNTSTVEEENNTTDEVHFNTTDEVHFNQDKQNIKQNIKQSVSDFSEEELKKNFGLIYEIYPKKTTKQSAYESYKKWIKGRKIGNEKVKLTNKQIYIAVSVYVKEKEDAKVELVYYKNFSTLMNQILDYVVEEGEGDAD